MESVFEKIVKREIPASIIYEDDTVLSFLDISPANKGHALVIPKEPSENLFTIDPDVLAHIAKIAQRIAKVLKAETGAEGVNILMNGGSAAGQEVMHAHMHVIPRFEGDGAFTQPRQGEYKEGECETLGKKLKEALSS